MTPQELADYQEKIDAGDRAKEAICNELQCILTEILAQEVIARNELKIEFAKYDNKYPSGRLFKFLKYVNSGDDPIFTHKDNQIHFTTTKFNGEYNVNEYGSIPAAIFFAEYKYQKAQIIEFVDNAKQAMRQKLLAARESRRITELIEYEKLKEKYGK